MNQGNLQAVSLRFAVSRENPEGWRGMYVQRGTEVPCCNLDSPWPVKCGPGPKSGVRYPWQAAKDPCPIARTNLEKDGRRGPKDRVGKIEKSTSSPPHLPIGQTVPWTYPFLPEGHYFQRSIIRLTFLPDHLGASFHPTRSHSIIQLPRLQIPRFAFPNERRGSPAHLVLALWRSPLACGSWPSPWSSTWCTYSPSSTYTLSAP